MSMATDEQVEGAADVDGSAASNDALKQAERRVFEHPAARESRELDTLRRMLTAVFLPNLAELLQLLNAPAANPELAIELVQNGLYASEWGEVDRILGGFGRDSQVTPPAWSSTRRR